MQRRPATDRTSPVKRSKPTSKKPRKKSKKTVEDDDDDEEESESDSDEDEDVEEEEGQEEEDVEMEEEGAEVVEGRGGRRGAKVSLLVQSHPEAKLTR